MLATQSNHGSNTSRVQATAQDFRDGMARLGASVNIITTDGPAGLAGFTASAVCSVTDSPPTLLVCLNRQASVYDIFTTNKVLCVNTLSGEHVPLSKLFGGKTPVSERFEAGEWSKCTTGSPVLNSATVSFDCEVVETMSMGTHDVLFCRILEILTKEEVDALIYFNRSYHRLA